MVSVSACSGYAVHYNNTLVGLVSQCLAQHRGDQQSNSTTDESGE